VSNRQESNSESGEKIASAASPSSWASTELTRLIAARRSVRDDFDGRPICQDDLREIVRAGLAAPSSKNARPWRFHVVSDRQLLQEIADAAATAPGANSYVPRDPSTGLPRPNWPSSVAESAEVLRQASTGIFVENRGAFSSGRRTLSSVPSDRLLGSLVGYTFEIVGIGAAVENMWLAANALGIQASFMGDVVIAESLIADHLDIELDLVGVLALGFSNSPVSKSRVSYDLDDKERVIWYPPPTGQ
jgi:nitroreductase